MTLYPTRTASASETGNERDILLTLFDLGRQVASVIDFDELLPRIPELIGRLIQFDAFAVYLFDERHGVVNIAYAIGYPDPVSVYVNTFGTGTVPDEQSTAAVEKVFSFNPSVTALATASKSSERPPSRTTWVR